MPNLKETTNRSREKILEYSHPATSPPANLPSSLACVRTIRFPARGSHPPGSYREGSTSAHRAEYNGSMSTPLLPPPALIAWSRTATSQSIPVRHIAATSPPTPKRNTQVGAERTPESRDAVEARAWQTRNSTGAHGTLPRRHEVSANSEMGALPMGDGLRGQTVHGKHRGQGR